MRYGGRGFGGSRIDQIMLKLSMCRRKLKEWSKREVLNSAREIGELMKKAGRVQDESKDVREYEELKEIKDRLNELWKEEEVYWYQRAKVN